jgi:hypothetical protein
LWLASRGTQHGLARTGTQINDHPLRAGGQVVELADVDVEKTATNHLAHIQILTARQPFTAI